MLKAVCNTDTPRSSFSVSVRVASVCLARIVSIACTDARQLRHCDTGRYWHGYWKGL